MKRVAIGVAAVVMVGAAAAYLLLRGDGGVRLPGTKEPSPTPGVVAAAFQSGDVQAFDADDRPEAGQRANEEAGKVVSLVNDYYNIAFLDPNRWQGGGHPDLAGLFTGDAQGAVGPNLGGLALADLAPRIRRVEPTRQDAHRISVLIEQDLSAQVVVVSTLFEATGDTAASEDGPVKITHDATFLLLREGDAYRIGAFYTNLTADTQSRTASFGDPFALAGGGT